jgi:cytochrome c oxidase subunit IV
VRTILTTLALLLVLTAATTGLAYVDLRGFSGLAALAIASAKALAVLAVFMHLRGSPRLLWTIVGMAVACLGVLLVLTMSDILTRGGLETGAVEAGPRVPFR